MLTGGNGQGLERGGCRRGIPFLSECGGREGESRGKIRRGENEIDVEKMKNGVISRESQGGNWQLFDETFNSPSHSHSDLSVWEPSALLQAPVQA